MQNEMSEVENLLSSQGEIRDKEFSENFKYIFNKNDSVIGNSKIKEEDCYIIYNHFNAFMVSVTNYAKCVLTSVMLIDLTQPWIRKENLKLSNSKNTIVMPKSPLRDDIVVKGDGYTVILKNSENNRRVMCHIDNFYNDDPIDVDISMPSCPDVGVCTVDYIKEKKKNFTYNYKLYCMPAHGIVRFQNKEHLFKPVNSTAAYRWGRGVITENKDFYNINATGVIDGVRVGFNIGCDLKDEENDFENALFVENKFYKLPKIKLTLHKKKLKDNMNSTWKLASEDGSVMLMFTPGIDCYDPEKMVNKHLIFGRFVGKIITEDDKILNFDEFTGYVVKDN